jgi:hypothetical protein
MVAQEMKVRISHEYIQAVILCDYREENISGKKKPEWLLTMRKEVAQALKELKIV